MSRVGAEGVWGGREGGGGAGRVNAALGRSWIREWEWEWTGTWELYQVLRGRGTGIGFVWYGMVRYCTYEILMNIS